MPDPTKTTDLVTQQQPPPTAIAVAPPGPETFELDVDRIIREQKAIDRLVETCFVEGTHYGVIPGTATKPNEKPKPVLFQAGAELANHLFRLRPEFTVLHEVNAPTLIHYRIRARLIHVITGVIAGEAVGSANSREKKYANQTSARLCPSCRAPAIIKGKEEYGGGWLCYDKKGGCKAKFKDGDPSIDGQTGAQDQNAVWDLDNTIFKIACKRGLVSATRSACGLSGRYDVDLDDEPQEEEPRTSGRTGGNSGVPTGNANAAAAAQQATSTAGGQQGGDGGRTPVPQRSGVETQDLWGRISAAKDQAKISTLDLFKLTKRLVNKDKPMQFTEEDGALIIAELAKIQEENNRGGA